ncbi:hypothetical protein RZS08_37190, partial [Arthrospira platensis SPKY1]|nr:hypothetical protein [Arthrospira platensis SPKY1]
MADNARELGLSYEQAAPTNQCGETCERAKLCAICLAEMAEQPAQQEPVAWMVTTEMQDGSRSTYPVLGRYKDAKDLCDFGEPVPLVYGDTTPPAPDDHIRDATKMVEQTAPAQPVGDEWTPCMKLP